MTHDTPAAFLPLAMMWLAMMAVMMTPTVWPWLVAFGRLTAAGPGLWPRFGATIPFAGGYASAWAGYAALAAGLQVALASTGWLDGNGALPRGAGAIVLVMAGAYQFVPLKRACLRHCRSPLTTLLNRWHDRAPHGFGLGLAHGAFCVGCCWALMATSLAVGMASVWWMALLAAIVFVEQVAPGGDRVRVPLGLALMAGGLVRSASG